ncbi:MAG: 1-phosphofructokinase [Chthonomonadales bacterium]|nr:1-phosphofructokinase [Chthonomonadales bacterium]
MILTVTPNAAVDKTYHVEGFRLDVVNRPTQTFTVAGGKGINVARVYQTLGGRALATGFLGGNQGRIVADALHVEGIPAEMVRVQGETRLCIAAIDSTTGTQTEINESGPEVSEEEIRKLFDRVTRLLSQETFSFVVLSGSLPPGAPPTLYAELIDLARTHKTPVALDTSGEPLREGLKARPWMVKPNQPELEAVLGRSLSGRHEALQAAQELLQSGIEVVVLTLGAAGALLVNAAGAWFATPPPIEFASAVASGDSFLAAFLWQWAAGSPSADPASALRLATGAGAANAAVIGAGFCTRESIVTLADRTEVVPIV